MGDVYAGVWTTAKVLTITVTDITNSLPPDIGTMTFTVLAGGLLKDVANSSPASTQVSGKLSVYLLISDGLVMDTSVCYVTSK